MSLLLVKLSLAPLLVVCSSLAGRRWGPAVSGLLVALPLVAGPILLITDLERGADFASHAASSSLLGLVALAAFVVVFARAARRHGWALAVGAGWIAFLSVALGLSLLPVGVVVAALLATGAFAVAPKLMPTDPHSLAAAVGRLPAWDLPARAIATALLVLSLTGAAAGLGPTLTGVLTPFPISTSVLAAFVLVQEGPLHANALLRGFLRGAFGFVAFCFLVAVLLIPAGTFVAFTAALCGALAAQFAALVFLGGRPLAPSSEKALRHPRRPTRVAEQSSARDSVRALP